MEEMALVLTNTLSRNKEEFVSLHAHKVSMYSCGPTVYNYAHIGNLRAFIFADILKRTLMWNCFHVMHVMNITDIGHLQSDADEGEDKMTAALKREGKPLTLAAMREVAEFYATRFREDIATLNILPPEHMPFASDHVSEYVKLVQTLIDKEFTYKTSDGIYYDTLKCPDYGKLTGGASDDIGETRIGVNPEKKNPRDFALWKFDNNLGYDVSIGKGFPGWHIECSGMAMKFLGDQIDIHTGGIDHIPTHHTNEIAQSESATGKSPFSRFWLHNAFLTVRGEKAAKSVGNVFYLKNIREHGIDPLALRYLILQAHYRSPIDFSWEALEASLTALKRLYVHIQDLREQTSWFRLICTSPDKRYLEKFTKAINNDLDTPNALALAWELVKDDAVSPARKLKTLYAYDQVLGFKIKENSNKKEVKIEIPEKIQKLLDERQIARKKKDWVKSDELRDNIKSLGYDVMDTGEGQNLDKN
jgi:cysteinyl-tRNA synthetase